jgi:hypothetical protein
MTDDDASVLGNLPRSRPGRRSGKRGTTRNEAPAPKVTATAKPTPEPQRGSDPVGETLRTAAKVAETGIRLTTGLAQEIVRRLPRP